MKLRMALIASVLIVLAYASGSGAQSTTLSNGLVGYWKFDSIGTNYSIADNSGNNNVGTVGTSSRLVPGKFGSALRFDKGGKGQHMATGNPFSSPRWTVSMWVNPDVPLEQSSPYFGNVTFFSGLGIDFLSLRNTDLMLYKNKIADFNFAANPGWHHVAITYDGTKITAYVDGANRGSYATTTNIMRDSVRRYIGTGGPGNNGHIFLGSIDEVRLYNRAITDLEVSSIFNSASAAAAAPVAPSPVPTSQFTTNLTVTTDKTLYKLGENVTMTATFTPAADWVQYLRSNNISRGEIKFVARDTAGKFIMEKTFAFDLVANPIRQQYVWATPQNTLLAGSRFSIETSVYDERKTTTTIAMSGNLSFEVTPTLSFAVDSSVVTSRLPAGVSPHLFGKITAERDISNEFVTPAPYTYTKVGTASQVGSQWFNTRNGTLDLSAYNGLWLTVENQSSAQVLMNVLPFKNGAANNQHAIWTNFPIPGNSGQRHILISLVDPTTTIYRCDLQNGMQRCPVGPDQIPPLSQDKSTGFASFTRDQFGKILVYYRNMPAGDRLIVHSIRAVNINYRPENMVGFVDRWGQNNWVNFPEKITSDEQLKAQGRLDSSTPNPSPANWDQYGGDSRYGGYPTTGFFKTAKVDGKWWLVTPAGNLFYAKGQNWVTHRTWGSTIRNRTQLFSNIPAAEGRYAATFESPPCQPNNNNPTGTGEFCGGTQWLPYFANIVTKYATADNTQADVLRKWGIVTKNRLQDWGFNAIKNTGVVPQEIRMSYTLLPAISTRTGVTKIPGTNMPEVFAPTYRTSVDTFMRTFSGWAGFPGSGTRGPTDPYNIGVFSDNELYFGRGTDLGPESETYYLVYRILSLNGATTPSKNAFTNKLREKYGTISAMQSAWGSAFPGGVGSWEQFNAASVTRAPREDLSMLLRYYVDEYYRIARDVSKLYYPNHLYLGSRFAGFHRTPNEAIDSCAQYCDVISINYYEHELNDNEWRYLLTKDKPIMITEWHVGMLARGAAFGGHNWVFGEAAGGEIFKQYVRSALNKNQIVGYFYHAYVDMPISGINFESENMYASFVTTSDQPKPDMVNAAKDINSRAYSIRGARANTGTASFSLTVGSTGTGSGTITATGIDCGSDCSEVVAAGTSVTLTATPVANSTFGGWSGDCTGTGTCSITVNANKVVTATFTQENTAPTAQPVTVSTRGNAVTINYVAADAEGDPITFNNGVPPTRGTLAPVPNAPGRFIYTPNTPLPSVAYTDGYNYNATDGRLTSPATRVTINYTPPQFLLTVSKTGNGTVTGTNINCGTDCTESINIGLSNILTATPATGQTFTGWSGACTGTGTCTVSMTQDRAVTANFVVTNIAPVAQNASYTTTGAAFDITLTANDTDTLTFAPSTLTTTLAILTRVREGIYRYTLKTPLPTVRSTDSFTFTASDGRLTSAPATISIVFTPTPPTQYSLNTSVVGSGSVTGTGINCGTDCTETVNTGTSITLTARPATGYTFSGWTGACTNTTGTCTVLVNADKNVTARFTLIPLADGDRDGVPDISDRCRLTPDSLRTQVNALGCVRPRMTRFNIRPNVEGDITAVNNVELGISSLGKIKFEQPVTLGRADGVVDLDAHVIIEKEKVEVKSSLVPELNKPSTITMYGVTKNSPRILKDGQDCNSPECNIQSYIDGTLVFTVTGFSTYTIDEIPVSEPVQERRRRSGGGGGSRTTVTPTVSNETLIQQLTAQLNLLIAQLNALTSTRTPVVSTSTKFNVTLALGSRHPDVRRLQQKLTSLGYAVPATGYYGPQTVAAVKRYQAANGIRQTGTTGALTRAQLNK